MNFLHQWSDEDNCTYTFFIVDKLIVAAVIRDTVEWRLKTCQVSSI